MKKHKSRKTLIAKTVLLLVFTASLFALSYPPASFAKLYKWIDENGNVHFTNVAPPQEYVDDAETRGETKGRGRSGTTGVQRIGDDDNGGDNQRENKNPSNDHPYRQAFENLNDIKILLQSSGVNYNRYMEIVSSASLKIGRLPNTKRANDLAYILDWYSIAGKCWFNAIYKKKKSFPYDLGDDISKIRTHFNTDVDSFVECRHVVWGKTSALMDEYVNSYR